MLEDSSAIVHPRDTHTFQAVQHQVRGETRPYATLPRSRAMCKQGTSEDKRFAFSASPRLAPKFCGKDVISLKGPPQSQALKVLLVFQLSASQHAALRFAQTRTCAQKQPQSDARLKTWCAC